MFSRREFALSGLAALGGFMSLPSCSNELGRESYDAAVRQTWRHGHVGNSDRAAMLKELVRYATLAASSHNTQCWRFLLDDSTIRIMPDFARRCPAVDPDDHHLFVSLGCATENLFHAALANGLSGNAVFDHDNDSLQISLERTQGVESALFQAIPQRQCTRLEYDGKPLSNAELWLLEKAGTRQNVRMIILDERTAMEQILEYVVEGNTLQMNDPAFVAELKSWIRFSASDAIRTGDGLYSASSGNPSVPAWLGRALFGFFFTPRSENDKYAKHVRSSAGIAVFVSESESRAQWIEVGRSYERFALQATALGIRTALLNQPVEVRKLRPQFASFLGMHNGRPDLVVRFGRGPISPRSLRRPVTDVLV